MSDNERATNIVESYTRKFTSFSGADIQAVFNGRVIGELQQITVSVRREKGPIYTMGSANPRCFARGKRGVAGTLVFTQFHRDALIEEMAKVQKKYYAQPDLYAWRAEMTSDQTQQRLLYEYEAADLSRWNETMTDALGADFLDETGVISDRALGNLVSTVEDHDIEYVDQLFPFDVTILLKNDYGVTSSFHVLGVELLNEAFSLGIDDLALERVYTYIALGLRRMRPFQMSGRSTGTEDPEP
ncbi:MAG TPA: hypothetical protein GX530_10270 [Corynebacteriales bacterium]|nr:hypothetical protein [Mycobacteriales bacterium]